MTIDRRNIFLWDTLNAGKYSPLFHSEDYTEDDKDYLAKNYNQPDFDWSKYPLRFSWKLKSEMEEKKLRTYDCFCEARGFLRWGGNGFFIHDWLLDCWSDLIDKDIKVISSTCSTLNGVVKEFHLIYIMNKVEGLDMNLSKMDSNENFKLFPKAENSFMKDHHLAIEKDFGVYIYHSRTKRKNFESKRKKRTKKSMH